MNTNEELKTRPDFEKIVDNISTNYWLTDVFSRSVKNSAEIELKQFWATHVEPLQAENEDLTSLNKSLSESYAKLQVRFGESESENQKLREQLKESRFVLQWHLDNSKPDSQIYQEDFFNLTANAISQADELLKDKTNP